MFRHLRLVLASLITLAFAATVSAGAQSSGPVITIGYTGPLSGGAAAYGTDVKNGIQMAIDEINADGGVPYQGKKATFKLEALDDEYHPNEAATNGKRLSQQDNAPVVFCSHSGGILALMGYNTKQQPNFIVAAYSSEPKILQQNNALTVMLPPSYDEYFKPYTTVEMKRFGKRLGLLATTTAYGNAWTQGFSAAWTAAGGTVLGNDSVDYNTTTDFSSAVSKALSEKPDVILVGGPSQPTGLVIKAARAQGYKGGFAIMDQAKFEQIEALAPIDQLDGSVGLTPFAMSTGAGLKPFLSAYDKKFGSARPANSEVGLNYEGMHIVAEAISLAGSTDPAAIMAKMHQAASMLPKKYQTLATHGLSKNGHLMFDVTASEVSKGGYKQFPLAFTE